MKNVRRALVRKLQWLQYLLTPKRDIATPPGGWTCFNCGETFTDPDAAADHFGTGEYESWPSACVERLDYTARQLRESLVDMYKELDAERDRSEELEVDSDNLHAQEAEIARRFNGARSVHQAWLVLDAMEGRALAAEQTIAVIETRYPQVVADARARVCAPLVMEL